MRNIRVMTELDILLSAKISFGILKPLFADLMLSFKDVQDSQSFFTKRSYSEAFKVIEAELGFTYEFFLRKLFWLVLDGAFFSISLLSLALPLFAVL